MEYRSKILGIFNQKGGVGKTTMASIIAEYAAVVKHLSVLVVDLDMQCNSSDYWVGMESAPGEPGGQLPPPHPDFEEGINIEQRSTIADIFYGKAVMPYETFIQESNGYTGYVDIMLGHPRLLEEVCTEHDNASGKIASEIVTRVGEFLHLPDIEGAYDLIILDTGPTRNPVFRSALRAATHAVIPFELEEKSKQGINAMLHVIQSENYARSGAGNELKLIGLIPNKVRQQTALHSNSLEELHNTLGDLMCPEDVYLPLAVAFPERDIKGISPKSIFNIGKSHKARQHAERVGEYVLSKLDLKCPTLGHPSETLEVAHHE
jgi:chromosome partitioning protein